MYNSGVIDYWNCSIEGVNNALISSNILSRVLLYDYIHSSSYSKVHTRGRQISILTELHFEKHGELDAR